MSDTRLTLNCWFILTPNTDSSDTTTRSKIHTLTSDNFDARYSKTDIKFKTKNEHQGVE
jgi:hypothetical protein